MFTLWKNTDTIFSPPFHRTSGAQVASCPICIWNLEDWPQLSCCLVCAQLPLPLPTGSSCWESRHYYSIIKSIWGWLNLQSTSLVNFYPSEIDTPLRITAWSARVLSSILEIVLVHQGSLSTISRDPGTGSGNVDACMTGLLTWSTPKRCKGLNDMLIFI